ncbi:MAG: hypothetical protein GX639_16520 [Fibrobacter sp.]|nr:hypothetical protein [Fibrobacter sp.]
MNKQLQLFFFLTLFLTGSTQAVEIITKRDDLSLSINGRGEFYCGQVVRGTGIESSGPVKFLWNDNAFAGISFQGLYKNKLKLVLGINAEMKFSWPMEMTLSQTKTAQPIVYIDESYGNYNVKGDLNRLDVTAGYFLYKYNPDVRNLGEYLFRSATYPAYIITAFDFPMARLLGLKISHSFLDMCLTQDLILSSETVFYPAMDWSLSYIVNYNIANLGLVNVGAGISLAHLISVYDYTETTGSATSPKFSGAQGNQYLTPSGDTAFYTFKGSKLMVRASIDPLAFVRENNSFFGESDLKLYGELLVIGLKSYPDTTLSGKPNPSY